MRWLFTYLWLFVCAEICDAEELGPRFPVENPFRGWTDTSVSQGINVRNWHFPPSRAKGGKIVGDTFENVTFEGVVFRNVILRNNVFLNCRFEHVVFAGGEWVGNRHIGGVMQKVELGNVENPYVWDDSTGPRNTRIDSNVIEAAEVSGWFFGGGFPDAFTITSLTFRNCRLWNNDMGNAVKVTGQILMDSCDIGERAWSMRKGLRQRKCRQSQFVDWIVGQRVDSMSVLNVDGDSVIDVVSDAKGGPRKQRYAMARKYARNVQFRHLDQSQVGGGEDILIEDVHGDHVDLKRRNDEDTTYIRRATLRNVDVETLRLGGYLMVLEDCVFENVNTDILDFHRTVFRRCTFRNVRIRKKLLSWMYPPSFENCVFENVHRDPGVKLWHYDPASQEAWKSPSGNERQIWESEEEWQRVQKKPWWKLW